jgi:hypothetical protein
MKANGDVEEADLKERGRREAMGSCKVGNGPCGSIQRGKRLELLSH